MAYSQIIPFAFWKKPSGPPIVIVITSGASWTVPADWNSSNNKIELIGAGAGGSGDCAGGVTGGAGVIVVTYTP